MDGYFSISSTTRCLDICFWLDSANTSLKASCCSCVALRAGKPSLITLRSLICSSPTSASLTLSLVSSWSIKTLSPSPTDCSLSIALLKSSDPFSIPSTMYPGNFWIKHSSKGLTPPSAEILIAPRISKWSSQPLPTGNSAYNSLPYRSFRTFNPELIPPLIGTNCSTACTIVKPNNASSETWSTISTALDTPALSKRSPPDSKRRTISSANKS